MKRNREKDIVLKAVTEMAGIAVTPELEAAISHGLKMVRREKHLERQKKHTQTASTSCIFPGENADWRLK